MYGKLDFLHAAFGIVPDDLDNYESTLDSPAFDLHNIDGKFLLERVTQKDFYLRNGMTANGSRKAKRVHEDVFLNMDLVVTSYQEQEIIGKFFNKLDHLISLHQRKLEMLKKVKKSMLEKMFPKNDAKVPELRFSDFTDAWEQHKVREVADRYDNLRIPVAANLRISGSTPYYGANGIQDYVDGYTHEGEFVLVAEDGANDLKNYPVKCVKGRIWVNNHAHVLQSKNEIADNKFLAFAISQADIEALLVGGGRAKLNAETLMEINMLLPKKQEQVSIGNYFTNLDHLISLHQRKLEKLKNIKKSMLEKMFII
ncbi:restriction endonuclease subunit S [Lachnospiraceae bacterium oral taxon 096]|nr:restriction endonuclease subunit S [Lachnospiraceae bacterium oral taxon 096]